jgi:hypothetical protein
MEAARNLLEGGVCPWGVGFMVLIQLSESDRADTVVEPIWMAASLGYADIVRPPRRARRRHRGQRHQLRHNPLLESSTTEYVGSDGSAR